MINTNGKLEKKAFSYTRWSSEIQSGNTSKNRQGSFTKEVCNELGLTLVDTVIDDGVSAREGLNLQSNFSTLLDIVNPSDYIIIEEWSRLSRAGFWTAVDAIRPLINKGIHIVVGRDEDGALMVLDKSNIDKRSIINKMLDGLNQARQENESRINKLISSHMSYRDKIKAGEYVPMAYPAPWLKCPRANNGRCLKEGQYILDEEMVKSVVKAYDMFVNQGLSMNRITNILNAEKVPTVTFKGKTRGKKWSISTLKLLLRNKEVIGYYVHIRNGVVEWESKVFPVIIPEDWYWRAQELHRQHCKYKGRVNIGFVNVLSGILKCQCGGGMSYHINCEGYKSKVVGEKHKYFMCNQAIYKTCPGKFSTIKVVRVEAAIRIILSKSSYMKEILDTDPTIQPSQIPLYEAELLKVGKQRKNLYNVIKSMDATPDDLVSEIKSLMEDEKKLLENINNERIRLGGNQPVKNVYANYTEKLADKWSVNEYRLLIRRALREMVEKTWVDTVTKTIKIWFKGSEVPVECVIKEKSCIINGMEFQYE